MLHSLGPTAPGMDQVQPVSMHMEHPEGVRVNDFGLRDGNLFPSNYHMSNTTGFGPIDQSQMGPIPLQLLEPTGCGEAHKDFVPNVFDSLADDNHQIEWQALQQNDFPIVSNSVRHPPGSPLIGNLQPLLPNFSPQGFQECIPKITNVNGSAVEGNMQPMYRVGGHKRARPDSVADFHGRKRGKRYDLALLSHFSHRSHDFLCFE